MPFNVPNTTAAAFPAQAGLDSADLSILAAGSGLTGVVSGCAVTAQGTPNMTVAVAAGVVRIGSRRVVVTGGNVTIATANATNPRHDLITVDTAGALAAVAGTPAAITATSEPVFPAIPAGRVVLAVVYVPAGDTAIDSTQITDKRVTVPDDTTAPPALTRSGTQLLAANGVPTRLVGVNAFDLVYNDAGQTGTKGALMSHSFVAGKLGFCAQQGYNWVRCVSLGASIRTATDGSGGPALITGWSAGAPVYTAAAWDQIDYVIATAQKLGIVLQIPLTEIWNHYHGGIAEWINLAIQSGAAGITAVSIAPGADPWTDPQKTNLRQFYTVRAVIDLFKGYITTYLNRTNAYTGLRQGAHGGIIWELGNELGNSNSGNTSAGPAWADEIAALIKSLAPSGLVADGYMNDGGPTANSPGLGSSSVDIVGTHYYKTDMLTTNLASLNADLASAQGAGKVFMVGEFGWSRYDNGQQMLDWVQANPSAMGAAPWSLIDPLDQHQENNAFPADDVPLHYPVGSAYANGTSGQTANNETRRAAVMRFFAQMRTHRRALLG